MDHPKVRIDEDNTLWLGFGEYGGEVSVAAISGDGARVLTVREVGTARIWEVETGDLIAELTPESPLTASTTAAPMGRNFKVFIESAALNADGRFALLGLNDGTAVIYHVDTGELSSLLTSPGETTASRWAVIRSVAFSPDDTCALVGFDRHRIGIWLCDGTRRVAFLTATPSGQLIGEPNVRATLTTSVAMTPDGRFVFAGANDFTATVFELDSGKVCFEAIEHADRILAIYDGEDGIGWATTNGNLWLQDEKGQAHKILQTGERWREVVFDRGCLLAQARSGAACIWSFDGVRTEICAPSETKKSRNLGTSKSLSFLDNANNKAMIFARDDHTISVRRGELEHTIEREHRIAHTHLSNEADSLFLAGWTDFVDRWNLDTGTRAHQYHTLGGTGCFAFSPDETLLVIGELGHGGGKYPRQIHVYEVSTGALLQTLEAHRWQIRQIAFSPDGKLLTSLGDHLIFWEVDDGKIDPTPLVRHKVQRSTGAFVWSKRGVVLVQEGSVTVFDGTHPLASFDAPISYGTVWRLSADHEQLLIASKQKVWRIDLKHGEQDAISADVIRPEHLPDTRIAVEHQARVYAALWRTDWGTFAHQGDGPRGWVQSVRILEGNLAVIPCKEGAVVLRVRDNLTEFVVKMPFEGKLRASCRADGEVLAVNHEGKVYRTILPENV